MTEIGAYSGSTGGCYCCNRENGAIDIARRLEPFIANAAEYRSDAKVLSALVAQGARDVSDDVLLRVEEIAEDIRSDLTRLAALAEALRQPSPFRYSSHYGCERRPSAGAVGSYRDWDEALQQTFRISRSSILAVSDGLDGVFRKVSEPVQDPRASGIISPCAGSHPT